MIGLPDPVPTCAVCGTAAAIPVEESLVPCNVRRFKDQQFRVWRCSSCRSIHGSELSQTVLAEYYRDYPYQRQKLDLMSLLIFDNLLGRLRRAGARKTHRILDYGCGSGQFVRFLRQKGYKAATGYDAYSAEFSDPAVLQQRYDCVVTQDVLEHVSEPLGFLHDLERYCRPGGIILIGTPNAEAIDLAQAGDFRHTLHQPYHLHILSRTALLKAASDLGWNLLRYYPRQYSNTLWPLLNQRFCLHYARQFDDTMDLAFDGFRFSWSLLTLRTFIYALFGYFMSAEVDVMVIFRAPATARSERDEPADPGATEQVVDAAAAAAQLGSPHGHGAVSVPE